MLTAVKCTLAGVAPPRLAIGHDQPSAQEHKPMLSSSASVPGRKCAPATDDPIASQTVGYS
jgi:hypothetical protein